MHACDYCLARAEETWAGMDCFSAGANASIAGDIVMWRALMTARMRLGPYASGQEMGECGLLCCGHERKNFNEQKKKEVKKEKQKKKNNTSTMASKMEPPMPQVLVC
jgi:hypothetical protein